MVGVSLWIFIEDIEMLLFELRYTDNGTGVTIASMFAHFFWPEHGEYSQALKAWLSTKSGVGGWRLVHSLEGCLFLQIDS